MGVGGLYSPKYSCKADFSCKVFDIVVSTDDNFRKITELIRPKNDFRTGVCSELIVRLSTAIFLLLV